MIFYGKQSIDENDIDAVKVIGDVQRISSLPNPAERQEICKAAVALVTATAYLAPQYSATHFSNFSIAGPCVKKSDFKTSTTASANCGRYCGADVDFVHLTRLTSQMYRHYYSRLYLCRLLFFLQLGNTHVICRWTKSINCHRNMGLK